jgi:hypothetical protein
MIVLCDLPPQGQKAGHCYSVDDVNERWADAEDAVCMLGRILEQIRQLDKAPALLGCWTEEQLSKQEGTGWERSPALPKTLLVFI